MLKSKVSATVSELPPGLLPRLFQTFSRLQFQKILKNLTGGQSGARVLLVLFFDLDEGKPVPYVVKIDDKAGWAEIEERKYQSVVKNGLQEIAATYRDRTAHVEGYEAVAYKLAFCRVTTPLTFRQLLEEKHVDKVKQLEQLMPTFIKWNRDNLGNTEWLTPLEMIYRMLGSRAGRVLKRVTMQPECWELDSQLIKIDIAKEVLPNPLAFMRRHLWNTVSTHQQLAYTGPFPCYTGRVHGDLNTGNVICHPTKDVCPNLIDFNDSDESGIPYYDLAYLELDTLLQCLPPANYSERMQWLDLLRLSMPASDKAEEILVPNPENTKYGSVKTALETIIPIRQAVLAIFKERAALGGTGDTASDFSLQGDIVAWWAAIVAAGLNFASKRKMDTTHAKAMDRRRAALLYASFGLDRLLTALEISPVAILGIYQQQWAYNGQVPDGSTSQGNTATNTFYNHFKHPLIASDHGKKTDVHVFSPHYGAPQYEERRLGIKTSLAESGFNVTGCPEIPTGSSCCQCDFAKGAGAVILLVDEDLTPVPGLLSTMNIQGTAVFYLIPLMHKQSAHVQQHPYDSSSVDYYDPPDVDVPAHQSGIAHLTVGDDFMCDYVAAKAILLIRGFVSGKL